MIVLCVYKRILFATHLNELLIWMENAKYMHIEHKKVYETTDWAMAMAVGASYVCLCGVRSKRMTYDAQNHNNLFIRMFALPTRQPASQQPAQRTSE